MRLWLAAAIIALVIAVGFFISVPHTRVDLPRPSSTSASPLSVLSVTLRDSFKKDVHTITGSVETPTACTTVSAAATLENGATGLEYIQVALVMPADTSVCLRLPTRVSFETAIAAPAGLPITVTVNGSPATTTPS